MDRVGNGFWRIAKERSESEYSWDSEGGGKMELAIIIDHVE